VDATTDSRQASVKKPQLVFLIPDLVSSIYDQTVVRRVGTLIFRVAVRPNDHCVIVSQSGGCDLALRIIVRILITSVTLGASFSVASAWWQFAANSPNGQRRASPHYSTLKECHTALKLTEAALAKQYPDLYPLVGSCEEYR
jgi:hypothetical protein